MATTQDLINQYMQGLQNPGNPAGIDMVTADAGNYLQNNFFQLPQYQLLYGQNATSLDPVQRFREDPGYQFALENGLNQVDRQGSSRGLLGSGTALKSSLQYSQGLADQNYQRYLGQNQGLFQDYQNRLANLTQMGSQNTGASQAMSNGQDLAGILSSLFSGQASANLSTGSNISSLLANQGAFGANAMMGTAAAQANNLLNGAGFQAQVDAANAASRSGSMNSLFQGLGANAGTKGGGIFGGLY